MDPTQLLALAGRPGGTTKVNTQQTSNVSALVSSNIVNTGAGSASGASGDPSASQTAQPTAYQGMPTLIGQSPANNLGAALTQGAGKYGMFAAISLLAVAIGLLLGGKRKRGRK